MSDSGIPIVSSVANFIAHPGLGNYAKSVVDVISGGSASATGALNVLDKPVIPDNSGPAPKLPTAADTMTAQQQQALQDSQRRGRSSTYLSGGANQGLLPGTSSAPTSSARTLLGA